MKSKKKVGRNQKSAKKKSRPLKKSFFYKSFLILKKIFFSKIFRLFLKVAFAISIVVLFISAVFIGYCAIDLPSIEKLSDDTSKPHIIIRSDTGEIIANYGDIYGQALTYSQLPKRMIQALIATEDRRFFDHSGIDLIGIIRAAYKNRVAGRVVQGGSTITQQLAKMIFLSADKTFKRKVQEAILAIQLERIFSKEQIMTMYLNRVFLGRANYGVDSAARHYFGKNTDDLSLYEIAIIIGMLKAPSKYAPPGGAELAINRGKQVLVNMLEAGFINDNQYQKASPPKFIDGNKGASEMYFFTDYVINELPQFIGNPNQNLDIRTSLSITAQHKLESAVKTVLDGKPSYNKMQVAAIIMNNKGEVKAMMGGRSYAKSQFNRAVSAKRQPGSMFKLFVYLAALENGYTLDQNVIDAPIRVGKWRPHNYNHQYMGEMSLTDSFAHSINTVAVRINEEIGRDKAISMAYRLGISSELPNVPSIALGAGEVTLIDLVSAYGALANDGLIVKDSSVKKITDSEKKILYRYKKQSLFTKNRVLSKNTVAQMKQILEASVLYGTSKAAKIEGQSIYGKTGTSQDYRDAWFIGIVNDMIIGVWVGHDDNTPMHQITGGKLPAEIFRSAASQIIKTMN